MHEIHVDEKLDIFIVKFYGTYTIEDVKAYHLELIKMQLPKTLRILEDYTDATPSMTSLEVIELVNFVERSVISGKRTILVAFLNTSPRGVALAQAFEHIQNSKHLQIKTFSSKKAAISWLQMF